MTTGQFYVRPGSKQEKWAGIMVIGPSYPHTVEPDTKQDFSLSISTAAGIPQASDLTPGAITIARVRAGVEATVVDADVCSAVAGVIYYEYTFPSASWQAGDEYKAVFSGQKVTVGGISYPLSEVRCGGRVSREHLGSYFEQTVPLAVNCVQHLDNTAANKDFIPSGTRGASGLVSTDDTKVKKVILTIIGSVVNTAGVANALDCTDPTHNQWQINLDGGPYSDLMNGASPDGQMKDNDWRLPKEGSCLGFNLSFDVTGQITNIDGTIGLRLENGRAEADGLEVTIGAYLTVLWRM